MIGGIGVLCRNFSDFVSRFRGQGNKKNGRRRQPLIGESGVVAVYGLDGQNALKLERFSFDGRKANLRQIIRQQLAALTAQREGDVHAFDTELAAAFRSKFDRQSDLFQCAR